MLLRNRLSLAASVIIGMTLLIWARGRAPEYSHSTEAKLGVPSSSQMGRGNTAKPGGHLHFQAASQEDSPAKKALSKALENGGVDLLFGSGAENSETLLGEPAAGQVLAKAIEVAHAASECLRDHLCGEAPSEEAPYFDPGNTQTHQLLAQSLNILKSAQDRGLLKPAALQLDDLTANLKFESSEIQILSAEILLRAEDPKTAFDLILGARESLVPDAKPVVYGLLSAEIPMESALHGELASHLTQEVSAGADPHAQMEILRGLHRISLSEVEFQRLAEQVCATGRTSRPWLAGRAYLKDYQVAHSFKKNPDQSCASSS